MVLCSLLYLNSVQCTELCFYVRGLYFINISSLVRHGTVINHLPKDISTSNNLTSPIPVGSSAFTHGCKCYHIPPSHPAITLLFGWHSIFSFLKKKTGKKKDDLYVNVTLHLLWSYYDKITLTSMPKHTHTHMHTHTHTHVCTHTHTHTHTCMSTHTLTYVHTHTHTHTNTYRQAGRHTGTHTKRETDRHRDLRWRYSATSLMGRKPQRPRNGVNAMAISGLWLGSLYRSGRSLCRSSAWTWDREHLQL